MIQWVDTGEGEPDFGRLEHADARDVDLAFEKLSASVSRQKNMVETPTFATFVSVAASVTTVGCMTLCTARLNIGSIRLPPPMVLPFELVAPLLMDTADTLDLRDDVRLSSTPPALLTVAHSSPDMRTGESERTGVSSVPDAEDVSGSGRPTGGLTGDECVDGITLPIEAERAEKAVEEAARSLPRRVWTTSWTWRLRGFFEEVGGGLTMM